MAEIKISELDRAPDAGPNQDFEVSESGNSLKLSLGQIREWLFAQIDGVPSGTICMWHGTPANIPVGWVRCDGDNGTPDMRGYAPFGAGGAGIQNGDLTDGIIPSHTHAAGNLSTNTTGNHSHGGTAASNGSHSHSGSTNSTGAHTHNIQSRPLGSGTGGIVADIRDAQYNSTGTFQNISTLRAASAGAHSHTLSVNNAGAHTHNLSINNNGNHSHTISGNTAASGEGNYVIPRSRGIHFIMKL